MTPCLRRTQYRQAVQKLEDLAECSVTECVPAPVVAVGVIGPGSGRWRKSFPLDEVEVVG